MHLTTAAVLIPRASTGAQHCTIWENQVRDRRRIIRVASCLCTTARVLLRVLVCARSLAMNQPQQQYSFEPDNQVSMVKQALQEKEGIQVRRGAVRDVQPLTCACFTGGSRAQRHGAPGRVEKRACTSAVLCCTQSRRIRQFCPPWILPGVVLAVTSFVHGTCSWLARRDERPV